MKHLLALGIFSATLFVSCNSALADAPTQSFDVNSIHVDRYGKPDASKPALVLIPGLSNSAAVWGPFVHRFAPSYTIYTVTLAGFGGRTPAAAPMLDKADTDIYALITQQKLDRPVVIGHSMGGFLTLRLASEHSAALRGAIALDGIPILPGMENMTSDQRENTAAQMAAQIGSTTPEQFMAYEKAYFIPMMTQAKNVATVAAFSEGADPKATGEYFRELMTADLRPKIKSISVPVLEITGFDQTLDPKSYNGVSFATPQEKQKYYEGLLANDKTATVKVIDNSRHFVMFDQPEALYADVEAFLKTL